MLSDYRRRSIIVGCLGLCISIFYLAFNAKLTLYVHPRYLSFTVILCAIAVALLAFNWLTTPTEQKPINNKAALLCIACMLLALGLPATTLSSRTAQTRLQDVKTTETEFFSSFDSFSQDYRHFDIRNWASFLATNPSIDQIAGKEANIEGFIVKDAGINYIARFRLACCAVDATPLSIPLSIADMSLSEGHWYRIEGTFVDDSGAKLRPLVITEIEEPDEPYIY